MKKISDIPLQDRPKWPRVQRLVQTAMGETSSGDVNYGSEERIAAYRQLAPWLPEFDEKIWFKEAIETRVKGLPADLPTDIVDTVAITAIQTQEKAPRS